MTKFQKSHLHIAVCLNETVNIKNLNKQMSTAKFRKRGGGGEGGEGGEWGGGEGGGGRWRSLIDLLCKTPILNFS